MNGTETPGTPPAQPFDPQNPLHWINVLHNAASVPKTDPRYADAQTAVNTALQHIGSLNRLASDKDIATANAPLSTGRSLAITGLQGLSSGTGELAAGVGGALTGKGFRAGAQNYRDAVDEAEASHPTLGAATELVGQAAPFAVAGPASGLARLEAGIPLRAGQVAGRIATGAAESAPIGFVQGFSGGGSDPGSFSQRLTAGLSGAGQVAALGGVTTGLGLPIARGRIETAADRMVGVQPSTPRTGYGFWGPLNKVFSSEQWTPANPLEREAVRRQAIVDARNATNELVPPTGTPTGPTPTEPPEITQMRARLAKQGFSEQNIEQLVQQAQSGGRPMAPRATMPPLSPEDAAAIEARRLAAVQSGGTPAAPVATIPEEFAGPSSPQVPSAGDRPAPGVTGPVNDRGQPIFRNARSKFGRSVSTTTTAPPEDLGTFPAPREDPGYTPARGLGVEGGPTPPAPTTPTILEMQEGRQPTTFEQRLVEGLTPPDASGINRPVGTQVPRQVTRSAAVRAPEIPNDPYAQGRTINPPPGATGVNLNSTAAEAQMRYLLSLTPKARAAALRNPLFAAFRAQLGQ